MNLPSGLFDGVLSLAAWGVFVPVLIVALRRAPWRQLADGRQIHLWLGMIVVLSLLWSLPIGVRPGLGLHFLGATVLALCCGGWLAWIGLCVVLAAATFNGAAGFEVYALNALLTGGVGVLSSVGVRRLAARLLPHQVFVFLFVSGFFAAALSVIAVGVAVSLLLALTGAQTFDYLLSEYLPALLLLAFSEAWLSGMLITLLVVYRPLWVSTYDDAEYFASR
ncbi:energy-coupling factor ABC transporter permease [Rhodocyclus tenuis]|uniref:energy-coupling factor ABC transporter permease n=1 Tax=Rhodocyclus tenuis TaxID=1066 RepID=UPI0019067EA5|nr:energy-coupling factor ABC transporter permease [Rhodocyclus tenuis]MBK1679068.1 hypothetical protein [Rhodocyclus tenuis]